VIALIWHFSKILYRVVKIFIHQIIEDVEQNDVPEPFYGHLRKDIEHNLPTEIQINEIKKGTRSVAVKIRDFRSIANDICNIDGLIDTYAFYKQLGFAQKNYRIGWSQRLR